MSEEELKAIERLENFINKYEPFVFYSKLKGDTAEVNPHIRDYEAYKTILNLIEKQQKEIEIKDKMIDLMAEKIFRDITDKKMKKAYGIDSKEDVKKMYFNILDEEF